MIFESTATLVVGGGRDKWGAPIPAERKKVAATIHPIRSVDYDRLSPNVVVSSWRMFGGPELASLPADGKVEWRGKTFSLEGVVEVHRVGPLIHHCEVALKTT